MRPLKRAHLLRSIGGGLGGALRNLPQESVARAKPPSERNVPGSTPRVRLSGAASQLDLFERPQELFTIVELNQKKFTMPGLAGR